MPEFLSIYIQRYVCWIHPSTEVFHKNLFNNLYGASYVKLWILVFSSYWGGVHSKFFAYVYLPYMTLTVCDVMRHDVINDEKVFHCANDCF